MDDPVQVLYVGDDDALAELATTLLERANGDLVVEHEPCAWDALERLAEVDCVVSGHETSGVDGLEFVASVRERDPDLPFVLLAGAGSEGLASEAISTGATDYLPRPTGADGYAVLANRIEHAVARRRAECQNDREAELERQNERLDELVSVVSHDLRNPLTVATGRLELAREECESEHLVALDGALSRMEELIDDLLALARHGGRVVETTEVELLAVAETCWSNVATTDADLRVEGDVAFEADRRRLTRLVENLFRNAVEHGSAGTRTSEAPDGAGDEASDEGDGGDADAGGDRAVTVWVGPIEGSDAAGRAGFFVEDDGPGIRAEEREHVFESGYSMTHDGTGFGLTIVERIVDAHGWEVDVTEGREGGARFEVCGVRTVSR